MVLQTKLNSIYKAVQERIQNCAFISNLLQKAEDYTGVPASYIVTAVTTSCLLVIFFGYGFNVLSDMIVVLFPAYKSFKAIETDDRQQSQFWIKYWTVFGMFHATEHIGDSMFGWLPGYSIVKLAFLLWCLAPIGKNGTEVVYGNYIRPTFTRNAEAVDSILQSATSATALAASVVERQAINRS